MLSFPFYVVSCILNGLGWIVEAIADWIYDQTSYRIWFDIHLKECRRLREQKDSQM